MNPSSLFHRLCVTLVPIRLFTVSLQVAPVQAFTQHRFQSKPALSARRLLSGFEDSKSSSGATEEDLQRWERLYYEGERKEQAPLGEERPVFPMGTSEIRVVSFDLDNTLWKTSATIDAANNALAEFLDSHGIQQTKRTEVIMGELFRENKERYAPIDKENAKGPVCLTRLRKDGIQKILETENGYSEDDATKFAHEAFETWVKARHDAISRNMPEGTIECLQRIASIRSSTGEPVVICAVTDGNSDPKRVQELAPFFDFCVNAEQVGVGKPDRRVYMEAVRIIASKPIFSDLFGDTEERLSDEELESRLGPYWIHVGDDFAKDIVPGKSMNMKTVWSRELILDKLPQQPEATQVETQGIDASVQDFVKKISRMQVIKMEIGGGDYLAQGLQNEFADATIDRLSDLSGLLTEWHQEGIDSGLNMLVAEDKRDLREESTEVAYAVVEEGPSEQTKFCIDCGAKLPIVAKFCSSCGAKQ